MHTENIWIVIVLLVVIMVGSNLLMLGAARGMRGSRLDFWKDVSKGSDSMQQQDKSLEELNRRVQALKRQKDDDDDGFKL